MNDGKFRIDGRIVKISNGEAIPEDEPIFILRARDRLAIKWLEDYVELSEQDGCNDYHFDLLLGVIERFIRFRNEHPDRMKQPSVTRGG